jgi:plasmid stabilization system protein ParE
MRVVYTADALGDVRQILSFIADQSPSHAPQIAARIDLAVKALGIFPRAGALRSGDQHIRATDVGIAAVADLHRV